MARIEKHIIDTYWIIPNLDNSIIHYGFVTVGNIVESVMGTPETFAIKQDWVDRLLKLVIELPEEELNE